MSAISHHFALCLCHRLLLLNHWMLQLLLTLMAVATLAAVAFAIAASLAVAAVAVS